MQNGRPQRAARVARFPATTDGNPYQRLLYSHLEPLGIHLAPDATLRARRIWTARRELTHLHFHWALDRHYRRADDWPARIDARPVRGPRAWVRAARFLAQIFLARALGIRIVWTVHEVIPHDPVGRGLDLLVARGLARLSHVLLAHDRDTAVRARSTLGRVAERIEVIPHPSYAQVYPPGRTRYEVRRSLGIAEDAFVFLHFGSLRPYKQLPVALEAFERLESPGAVLLVAGAERDPDIGRRVRAAAARDPRIRPPLGTVPDAAVVELFGACDCAIVARADGGTSGSLMLALSMGVPVVAADRPAYRELLEHEGAGWLFSPGDPHSLRAALACAASEPSAARRKGSAGFRVAARCGWPDVAARTAAALIGALET